jgi:hypothetical protein
MHLRPSRHPTSRSGNGVVDQEKTSAVISAVS